MPMPADMAQALGSLINEVNPYTEKKTEPERRPLTGPMDIYTGAAAPDGYSPAATAKNGGNTAQIRLETDSKYPGEWMFKGQPHRVSKSVRIRYRFPVLGDDGSVLYWTEDYLLIGFEGANGG